MTQPSTPSSYRLSVPGVGPVDLSIDERGQGRAFLVLHGGAGPLSVAGLAGSLAAQGGTRVLTPTHPGFERTPRPDALSDAAGLASVYESLLDRLDLTRVVVIGNSLGGWIAAQLALGGAAHRIDGIVLLNAVGIAVEGHPIAETAGVPVDQIMALSYHDPAPYRVDPASLPDERKAAIAANREAIALYGGPTMCDPELRGRLGAVKTPALVVWGESDRIADLEYGRAFSAAIPGARFEPIPRAGHFPQIERADATLAAITRFTGELDPGPVR
ncbi:alpha/beta fold hydrolase [Actinocrinis puniceicyclus]|uniref:Alpha/beta fold hydrolase n=1 Tax=Actinocrinis puniceicyclus TaxID=977794 RepID=A0A8J7WV85_9ACTN|nr:alpha/beta hydrolase [Actinocrinis puniceicyclus]MBS2965794.1 alpha/beta fold hydrolase [Actinocrinis puniceicyclus]